MFAPDQQGEPDLIEMLANQLMSPWARQRLSNRTLTQWRRALFTPEERATLQSLQVDVGHCMSCQRKFEPREAIVLAGDTENPTLFCYPCGAPVAIKCAKAGCTELVTPDLPLPRCQAHQKDKPLKDRIQWTPMRIEPVRLDEEAIADQEAFDEEPF